MHIGLFPHVKNLNDFFKRTFQRVIVLDNGNNLFFKLNAENLTPLLVGRWIIFARAGRSNLMSNGLSYHLRLNPLDLSLQCFFLFLLKFLLDVARDRCEVKH